MHPKRKRYFNYQFVDQEINLLYQATRFLPAPHKKEVWQSTPRSSLLVRAAHLLLLLSLRYFERVSQASPANLQLIPVVMTCNEVDITTICDT